ncbi:chromosome partitioning protein ParB [Candidatus Marinamargulisbacteria bacterium SCGC AG-343-D04]|nr:chromosome partitioning protein ParB [Candidatus Marinamargulisbacteria bacterium SCGC AG-343-D04]
MIVSVKKEAKALPRLGRGVEALFGRSFVGGGRSVLEIPLKDIVANQYQPRKTFCDEALERLVHSIKENGLAQPIVVRAHIESGYELIAGERRLRACEKAGFSSIPAIIKQVTDKQSLQLALVENLDREDLNPVEIALGYQRLMEEFQYTHQEVADLFHRSRSAVTNTLRLLQLPSDIRELLVKNQLTEGHARVLLSLDDEDDVQSVLRMILSEGMSVREAERFAASLGETTISLFDDSSETVDRAESVYTEKVRDYFSQKNISFSYKPKGDGGRLSFSYKDKDELENLLSVLGVL